MVSSGLGEMCSGSEAGSYLRLIDFRIGGSTDAVGELEGVLDRGGDGLHVRGLSIS